jgi:hypothetical protein
VVALPGDSSVVVKNNNPARAQFGVIQFDGTVGPAFGLPAPLGRALDPRRAEAALASSRAPGFFWAGARFYHPEVTLWTVHGERRREFRPSFGWYVTYDSTALAKFYAVGAGVRRPLPWLRAIHETEDGVLWLAYAVAASDWRPDSVEVEVLRSRSGEVRRSGGSRLEHYDGVLVAMDTQTGEVLISVRTADIIVGFGGDTLAYARRQGPDDVPQVALFSLTMKR